MNRADQRGRGTIPFYFCVTFASALLLEVLLEAFTKPSTSSVGEGVRKNTVVALGLTIGEFAGCCVISKSFGGTLADDGYRYGPKSWAPYIQMAFLLVLGTGLPNLAVHWVQYPLKVTIKSSKLMLAMAVAYAFKHRSNRKYTASEYAGAFLLTVGNVLFSFGSGQINAPPHLVLLGVILLLVASLSDVIAVNMQQWKMQEEGVAPMSLMLRQNFIGLIGNILVLLAVLASNSFQHDLKFQEMRHLLFAMTGIGLLTGFSCWANTHIVNEGGAVQQVKVSSLRKIFTVMLSYILFPKHLTPWRGFVLALLGAGLSWHLFQCRGSKTKVQVPKQKIVACEVPEQTPEQKIDSVDNLNAAEMGEAKELKKSVPAQVTPELGAVNAPLPMKRDSSEDSSSSVATTASMATMGTISPSHSFGELPFSHSDSGYSSRQAILAR
ncbi:unnamed protein product [Durusdinium trenchii]|uniref:UAA transporter n=1 Tax=Durusdinium trenchii TaxID=1381693 RepID=A0ABP0SIQ3_9DINO